MAALGSQSIASSYEQLLHVDADGGGNSTTHVSVKDGDNGTTFGFTIASDALMMSSTNRLEFGDTGTYIHQSADGVLDLVSDTELELNATTIDINGAVEISGHTIIESTSQFRFGDTGTYIFQSADGVLDLVSDTEIELNATTIDINGAVDISGDTTIAGDVIMADGKGIDFSADASPAAGMTAEILDDYEEGTWTASLTSATPPTVVPTDTGYYTKIGRLVHVHVRIENADTTGGSGAMSITGLPFTVGNDTAMGAIAMSQMFRDTNDTITAWFGNSLTTISAYETVNGDEWTQLSISAGAGKYVQISGSYTV